MRCLWAVIRGVAVFAALGGKQCRPATPGHRSVGTIAHELLNAPSGDGS